ARLAGEMLGGSFLPPSIFAIAESTSRLRLAISETCGHAGHTARIHGSKRTRRGRGSSPGSFSARRLESIALRPSQRTGGSHGTPPTGSDHVSVFGDLAGYAGAQWRRICAATGSSRSRGDHRHRPAR